MAKTQQSGNMAPLAQHIPPATRTAIVQHNNGIVSKAMRVSNGALVPPHLKINMLDMPYVQEALCHRVYGNKQWSLDPSKAKKAKLTQAVHNTFMAIGICDFPIYRNPQPVKISGTFFISRMTTVCRCWQWRRSSPGDSTILCNSSIPICV
jgi:hypothetical protein